MGVIFNLNFGLLIPLILISSVETRGESSATSSVIPATGGGATRVSTSLLSKNEVVAETEDFSSGFAEKPISENNGTGARISTPTEQAKLENRAWPKLVLATAKSIITFDPKSNTSENVQDFGKNIQALGLTVAQDTICYGSASPPFLQCVINKSPWSPAMYFRDRRDQVRRNSRRPRLQLDDFGTRLLYLDPVELKLHLIFLNRNNDRVELLSNKNFSTFAMDWSQGVLATLDDTKQLVLWTFDDSGVPSKMVNYTVKASRSSVLICDTSSSTFYLFSTKSALWYLRYAELAVTRSAELKYLTIATIVAEIKNTFIYNSSLYFLASGGDQGQTEEICRFNLVGSHSIECLPLLPKLDSTFFEVAHSRQTTSNTDPCDSCSHRCFPKFPKGVTCGCPFSHYGVKVDSANKCTSENTVAAVIINLSPETSDVRLVNYVTKKTDPVDLKTVTGTAGIQPIGIVPLWTSHDPERFCIQSRLSDELIITCHNYANVSKFTQVPWKAPKTKLTILAVSNLNDANSSWIVTWLENNEVTFTGCIRYQKSGTFETLTLYCHFDQSAGLWGYTNLRMDHEYVALDPAKLVISYFDFEENELLQIKLTSDGEKFDKLPYTSEPYQNSMNLKMNSISFFGNRGLTLINKFTSKTLRMGNPSSRVEATSRKFLTIIGNQRHDFCWLESRKNTVAHQTCQPIQPQSEEAQWYNIVCTKRTRTETLDAVVYSFSPNEPITSFEAGILNPTEHQTETTNDCITGNHNCSHLCVPLQGNHTKNRYKCACPDEYPILIDAQQCSLRLVINIAAVKTSHSKSGVRKTTAHRIINNQIDEVHIGNAQGLQYIFTSTGLCRIESQGIVCGDRNEIISGTQGATYIIKGHTQVQKDEIYWLRPSKKKGNQCIFLSSPGKNITMKLRCYPFSKIHGHVTVDSEHKILFWFTQDLRTNNTGHVMINRRKISDPKIRISSSAIPEKNVTYSMLQSVACDESTQRIFAAFYDPADGNTHIYLIKYGIDENMNIMTVSKFFADYLHQITAIAAVKGHLFWYDKLSGWIYAKRPNSDRALKIHKVNGTYRGKQLDNFNVTSIAADFAHSDIQLNSRCKDSKCDYFCDVRNSSAGPVTQCLCPLNLTEPANFFMDCPKVEPRVEQKAEHFIPEQTSENLILPLSLSFGILIMIVAAGNIVWCVYSRQKQKRKIQHIVRAFMDGDVQRAVSSKDNAVKAQFLPFTAIIAPDDLVLNEKKILGEGNFGTVYEGMYQRTPVAVKTTKSNLDPQTVQDFLRELKIQAYVGDHSNVVFFFGAEVSRIQSSQILVVLELCPHGNLLNYMRLNFVSENRRPAVGVGRTSYVETLANGDNEEEDTEVEQESETKARADTGESHLFDGAQTEFYQPLQVPEPKLRQRKHREVPTYTNVGLRRPADEQPPTVCFHWARQIAAGMEYLESKRVVHGDMAARNILVFENDTVKISDFGFSRNVYQKQTYQKKQNCALPYQWASPETLSRLEFSSKADVWSFGVTMWEIFTFGNMPFANTYWDYQFVDKLVNENMRLPKPPFLTNEMQVQLLDVCWKVKPEERACFTELKEALDVLYYARTLEDGSNI